MLYPPSLSALLIRTQSAAGFARFGKVLLRGYPQPVTQLQYFSRYRLRLPSNNSVGTGKLMNAELPSCRPPQEPALSEAEWGICGRPHCCRCFFYVVGRGVSRGGCVVYVVAVAFLVVILRRRRRICCCRCLFFLRPPKGIVISTEAAHALGERRSGETPAFRRLFLPWHFFSAFSAQKSHVKPQNDPITLAAIRNERKLKHLRDKNIST